MLILWFHDLVVTDSKTLHASILHKKTICAQVCPNLSYNSFFRILFSPSIFLSFMWSLFFLLEEIGLCCLDFSFHIIYVDNILEEALVKMP